jgi:hypothetical protein
VLHAVALLGPEVLEKLIKRGGSWSPPIFTAFSAVCPVAHSFLQTAICFGCSLHTVLDTGEWLFGLALEYGSYSDVVLLGESGVDINGPAKTQLEVLLANSYHPQCEDWLQVPAGFHFDSFKHYESVIWKIIPTNYFSPRMWNDTMAKLDYLLQRLDFDLGDDTVMGRDAFVEEWTLRGRCFNTLQRDYINDKIQSERSRRKRWGSVRLAMTALF